MHPKNSKNAENAYRNCKNHIKNATNDMSGITDILPGLSPYWLSPIISFHHFGYPRYYRDILESVKNQGWLPWQGHFCVDWNLPPVPRHRCFYCAQAPCLWPQDVPLFQGWLHCCCYRLHCLHQRLCFSAQLHATHDITGRLRPCHSHGSLPLWSLLPPEGKVDYWHVITLDKVQNTIILFSTCAPRDDDSSPSPGLCHETSLPITH